MHDKSVVEYRRTALPRSAEYQCKSVVDVKSTSNKTEAIWSDKSSNEYSGRRVPTDAE